MTDIIKDGITEIAKVKNYSGEEGTLCKVQSHVKIGEVTQRLNDYFIVILDGKELFVIKINEKFYHNERIWEVVKFLAPNI